MLEDDILEIHKSWEMPLYSEILSYVHPLCNHRDYLYLFTKLFAPDMFPSLDKLIIIDPDMIVLGSIKDLWHEFDKFNSEQVISTAFDQSDRYYYRLQNPEESVFSVGWVGVPGEVGCNTGVVLLFCSRMRNVRFSAQAIALSHEGIAMRQSEELAYFCDLAEQDVLNLLLIRQSQLFYQLHCSWNYMPTSLGGHSLAQAEGFDFTFYDVCPEGVRGSGGQEGEDLLKCSCGHKINALHFVGGMRKSSSFFDQLTKALLTVPAEELRITSSTRAARPNILAGYEK